MWRIVISVENAFRCAPFPRALLTGALINILNLPILLRKLILFIAQSIFRSGVKKKEEEVWKEDREKCYFGCI